MMSKWLLAFSLAATASAAELARWDAGTPPRAAGISVSPAGTLPPNNDYYERAAFTLTVEKPAAVRQWLVLEYLDRGYALISISPGVAQSAQSGIARLNTGRYRRAIFRFDKAPEAIRVWGIQTLRSVALVDSEPAAEPVPLVEPAVKFSTPSQRVTTAGADAGTLEGLPETLATMRNQLPLMRALGFNGIESYVKWDFIERSPGVFDWSFYDAVVAEIDRHGMQWFPLLIVGSAYSLPAWFHDSPENHGFECLEHGIRVDIQSTFCGVQDKYVRRFLHEFGKHYGGNKALLGIRLGPSGNYGEAQYPARGDLGYKGGPIHTHIGYWANDPCAQAHFRQWLRQRYPAIEDLNRAWGDKYESFDQVRTFLPITAATLRKRADFGIWYMDHMSRWCEIWAEWAREALPNAVIHQSSGGWGLLEVGTDYTYQARSMARLKGGIRLTNESDNYVDNFTITRMASSAARFYGAPLGYEPGGFGSARGVVARLYNCVSNGGVHLFYYNGNFTDNDQGIDAWLRHAPLLDRRARPVIDVGVFYPDTGIKLDDELVRHRWASVFLMRAQALRGVMDYDYVSEQMILDGALDHYKAIVLAWGHVTEKPVLERIARWVENGGTLIYQPSPRGHMQTVEGDRTASTAWQQGKTGKGRVIFYNGDQTPGEPYAQFVLAQLKKVEGLRPAYRRALVMRKPAGVYWSVLENGETLLLNFNDTDSLAAMEDGRTVQMKPYTVVRAPAGR